jgi:xylono-1,5-lactonase
VMQKVKVPAGQVSSIAFGGPDLKTLFVTSARDGLDAAALAEDPGAGNLFVFETDVAGLPGMPFTPGS